MNVAKVKKDEEEEEEEAQEEGGEGGGEGCERAVGHGEIFHGKAGEITLRIPIDKGLAGACATKGEKILIPDAYKERTGCTPVDTQRTLPY